MMNTLHSVQTLKYGVPWLKINFLF